MHTITDIWSRFVGKQSELEFLLRVDREIAAGVWATRRQGFEAFAEWALVEMSLDLNNEWTKATLGAALLEYAEEQVNWS